MNPIYKLRHKIQMLKDFLQLLSTGPVTLIGLTVFKLHKTILYLLFMSLAKDR